MTPTLKELREVASARMRQLDQEDEVRRQAEAERFVEAEMTRIKAILAGASAGETIEVGHWTSSTSRSDRDAQVAALVKRLGLKKYELTGAAYDTDAKVIKFKNLMDFLDRTGVSST